MGPVKTRLLLRRWRRELRKSGENDKASAVSQILASRIGVELFSEEFEPVCRARDGSILDMMQAIFEYIVEHQDEIMELVEMIIKIIAAFS